jgi:hypothetical protein
MPDPLCTESVKPHSERKFDAIRCRKFGIRFKHSPLKTPCFSESFVRNLRVVPVLEAGKDIRTPQSFDEALLFSTR